MKTSNNSQKVIIGTTVLVDFGHTSIEEHIPGRVDSGARTSSLWASHIVANGGEVTFQLFDDGHPNYTGENITLPIVDTRTITSSMGNSETRHVVEFPVVIAGVSLTSQFTLANRSTQTYPILVGRSTLAGNFLVDCSVPGEAIAKDELFEYEEFNQGKLL